MYAVPLLLSAATAGATTGLPFFQMGQLHGSVPIQWFGLLVATGVLIGASILRRYGEWHGVSDDHIRGLIGWITITGFIGAHVFDVVAYQGHKDWWDTAGIMPGEWPLMLRIWDGISSYGGFIGGSLGFAFFVWWKELPSRLFADMGVIGLLFAFSVGRIGCTVVSDHIGAAVDPNSWQAMFAMPYPRGLNEVILELQRTHPGTGPIHAWNLGFVELIYLIPVNALILWLGFRRKRLPAGLITVLTGVLYAPVRFFLDYLRPENSDPRHFGFTFAQWASLLAFGAAVYVALRIMKNGKAAEVIAPTSREAQDMLKVAFKEPREGLVAAAPAAKVTKQDDGAKAEAKRKAEEAEEARAAAQHQAEEAEEQAAQARRRKQDEALERKQAEDAAAKVKADDAKADEPKADDTKADDAKADDAKADDAKADDAKADETDDASAKPTASKSSTGKKKSKKKS